MMKRSLGRLLGDESGAAAIELALVAPVIAGMAIVSFQVWDGYSTHQDARAGLDAGVEYYLSGGLDDAAARTVAQDAWRHRPNGGSVTTQRGYQCGETITTEGAVCPGGRTAATYVTLTASAVDGNGESINEGKTVRVR